MIIFISVMRLKMNIFRSLQVAIMIFSVVACQIMVDDLVEDNTIKLTRKIWAFDSIAGYNDFQTQLGLASFNKMTYHFNVNGTYASVILGASGAGIWEFNADKSVIILDSGTVDVIEWTIITLNVTELIVSFKDPDALNGRGTWIFN